MTRPSIRDAVIDQRGSASREYSQWLQALMDRPLRSATDSANPPSAPAMKKDETIVFKATGISKTYIVHYDGTVRYYWEATGTDLY